MPDGGQLILVRLNETSEYLTKVYTSEFKDWLRARHAYALRNYLPFGCAELCAFQWSLTRRGAYRFTLVSSCCGRRERAVGNSEKVRLTYWVTVSMPFRYCSSSGVIWASTSRTWRDGSAVSKRAQNQGSPRVRIRSFSGRCHSNAQLSTRGQSWIGKRPPIISPGSGGRRKW